MVRILFHSSLIFVISCITVAVTEAFVLVPSSVTNIYNVKLSMATGNGDSKKGYRFGDLTRGVLKKVQGDGSSSSSFSSYKFGDISRWLDKKAKEGVSTFTNKKDYKFGDMSKEILRRLRNGDYSREDLALFLKIITTIGINLSPAMTASLPLKVLTDLLNLSMEASIAQSVGSKVITSITTEIDGRVKEMVTGDRNYQTGDITKRALSKWTGKENYEVGDIAKKILDQRAEAASDGQKSPGEGDEALILFSSESEKELLEEFDKKLLKARREKELGGTKDDEAYKEWDEKFLSS